MIKNEFKIKMRSGSCPGGHITFSMGNAGTLCNMHIKAGYHEFKEASIDMEVKEAKELIEILKGLITIHDSDYLHETK